MRRQSTHPPRLALVYAANAYPHDAILAYSDRLAAALSASRRVDAVVVRLDRRGRWSQASDGAITRGLPLGFDAYLLQYNPFSFGRWGVAPSLPLAWYRLGRRGGATMVVTVHEAHVRPVTWRYRVMGLWQRNQLAALLRASDSAIATCQERADQLAAIGTRISVRHVPVGANLDEVADEPRRSVLRERLRGRQRRPIIATFGSARPSRSMHHLDQAILALAEAVGDHVLLNLGASAPPVSALPRGTQVVTPGPLEAQELSLHLSCADLVLLPFVDGATANKTTLVAALRLGRPVLSTDGPATDPLLRDPGLRLVNVEDIPSYCAAAVALMRGPHEREALGRRARALYQRAFSWDVIAFQILDALGFSTSKALNSAAVGLEVSLDDGVP